MKPTTLPASRRKRLPRVLIVVGEPAPPDPPVDTLTLPLPFPVVHR